jgi:hypothetical protein
MAFVPGFAVRPVDGRRGAGACDEVVTQPTFVVSHDDPYNLAHNMNDVIGLWAATVLAGRATNGSMLVNMDGFRKGGPAGGAPHRIIRPSEPDGLGPFNKGYYHSWFGAVRKAASYGRQRVCFQELYLPPMPGVPWIWGDWSVPSDCATKVSAPFPGLCIISLLQPPCLASRATSKFTDTPFLTFSSFPRRMQASSPLYQSFNVFLRHRWVDARGLDAVAAPDRDRVHVVVGARAVESNKNKESTARFVKNMDALVAALGQIRGVRVTVQDFAKIDFAAQVGLCVCACGGYVVGRSNSSASLSLSL